MRLPADADDNDVQDILDSRCMGDSGWEDIKSAKGILHVEDHTGYVRDDE